jgi:hypothetical protein
MAPRQRMTSVMDMGSVETGTDKGQLTCSVVTWVTVLCWTMPGGLEGDRVSTYTPAEDGHIISHALHDARGPHARSPAPGRGRWGGVARDNVTEGSPCNAGTGPGWWRGTGWTPGSHFFPISVIKVKCTGPVIRTQVLHSPEPRGRTDPRSGDEGELEAAARAIGGGRVGGTGGVAASSRWHCTVLGEPGAGATQ